MKVRATNCTECRKRIHAEEQEAYLKKQYAYLNDGIYTMAVMSAAVALSVLVQRDRSKAYIQKFYDDMVMIYGTAEVLGKPLILTDVIKQLEQDYGVDFSRLHVNFNETQKEFIKGAKSNGR